jgi:hypothetical protein
MIAPALFDRLADLATRQQTRGLPFGSVPSGANARPRRFILGLVALPEMIGDLVSPLTKLLETLRPLCHGIYQF